MAKESGFNPFEPAEQTTTRIINQGKNHRLIKFCKSEHNLVRGCTTIRLGTTSYFRDLEASNELADDTEGVGVHNQNWRSGTYIESNNTVFVEMHNSYIFCASMDNDPKFEGYEDKYYINDHGKFGQILQRVIASQLKGTDLEVNILPKRLGIQFLGNPVTYGKVGLSHNPLFLDAPDPDMIYDLPFRKPLRYERENEFRMIFMVGDFAPSPGCPQGRYLRLSPKANMIFDISTFKKEIKEIISL